ncbi:hypothetical protein CPB84DRAFT_1685806, partial [Gymnopilus junonius]
EILSHVFLLTLPENFPHWDAIRSFTPPLLLCQVCQRWRDAAIHYPTLWSYFSIESISEAKLYLLRTWIERSVESPLTISVNLLPTHRLDAWDPPFNHIISLIFSERNRWRNMYFSVPASAFTTLDFPEEANSASNLKQLHFQLHSGRIPPSFKAFLSHSPVLSDFTLKTEQRGVFPLLENLPWSQLTDLHLECVLSPEEYQLVFQRSPMLRTCHLQNVSRELLLSPIPARIQPPITLAYLHYLHVTGEPRIFLLFDSVTLPSLQTLVIGIIKPGLIRFLAPLSTLESLNFQKFIERSSPPLQVINFDNVLLQENILIDILALLPTMQSLTIDDDSNRLNAQLSDKLLQALGGRNGVAFICPGLTTICLTGQLSTSDGIFAMMVSERWGANAAINGVTPLKIVQVELSRDNKVDIECLTNFRWQGLKVVFSF